jgi:NADP-dependent 3-hydroxy acid dehydrogenase YdfG
VANNNGKVWLITGSFTGFGRFLAEAVWKKGDRAIATARKPEQLSDLVAQSPETAVFVRLDVTNPQSLIPVPILELRNRGRQCPTVNSVCEKPNRILG